MINYNLKINFQDEKVLSSDIVFVSGDIGAYKLIFDFYDNGRKVDISKYTLTVKAKRSDGVKIASAGEIENGQAVFVPENNIYAIPGDLYLEIALCDATGKYITAKIIITSVIEGLGETDLKGADVSSVYVTLLGNLQSKIDQANQLIEDSIPQKGVDYYTEEEKEEMKVEIIDALPDYAEKSDVVEIEKNNRQTYSNALICTSIGQVADGDDVSPIEHEMEVTLERLNIFDNSQWVSGQISDTTGEYDGVIPDDNTTWANLTYIPITQPMYFTSLNIIPYVLHVYLYDKDKKFLNQFSETFESFNDLDQLYDMIDGSNAAYFRVMIVAASGFDSIDSVLKEELVMTKENKDKYYSGHYYAPYIRYEEIPITVNSYFFDENTNEMMQYNKTYYSDADGIVHGVMSPPASFTNSFTIWCNPGGACIISCKYNKDANKVIEKLTNAIISLGGNV